MYEDNKKPQRESKSATLSNAFSQLEKQIEQLESLAAKVVGRVVEGGNIGKPQVEQSPCPAVILNTYPDRLRTLRERIQKAYEEITEALF
jgi:hypothetical protein